MLFQTEIVTGLIQGINIFFLIVTSIFLLFFLREYIKTKNKMFGYLTIFFLTYFLQNFFQAGEMFYQSIEEKASAYVFQEIFRMLVLYSMIVLLEVFERDVTFSRRQSIMTILIFTTIGAMLSTPTFQPSVDPIFSTNWADEELIGLLQLLFYVVAGVWLILMLYRNYRTAWSNKQRKVIKWLSMGVFLTIFFPFIAYFFILFFTSVSFVLLAISVLILLIFNNLGIYFIGIAFLRIRSEPWLLQRQKVHLLIVYSKDGVLLYSKTFDENISEQRTLLLAGGFSAITSLFKEATATAGEIKSILLEDKELRIISKEHFLCAILVDYSTQASESAQNNFVLEFEKLFKEDLESFDGEVSRFNEAKDILERYFS